MAKNPINKPIDGQSPDYKFRRWSWEHTWCEILVFLEKRLGGRSVVLTSVCRVVTLQFHTDRLLGGVLAGLVDDRIVNILEFPRRRHVEKRVFLRRRETVDNVGKEPVYLSLAYKSYHTCKRPQTIVRKLLRPVRSQGKHGKVNGDNARSIAKWGWVEASYTLSIPNSLLSRLPFFSPRACTH